MDKNLANKKDKREIDKIASQILDSLKKLEDLAKENEVPFKYEGKSDLKMDLKGLGDAQAALGKLEHQIAFFEENKKLAGEIKAEINKNYKSIDPAKKKSILDFIKESYSKERCPKMKEAKDLTKAELIKMLDAFTGDLNDYIKKTSEKITELKKAISEEKESLSNLRRDSLKKKFDDEANARNAELEKLDENKRFFEEELERLEILEDELKLAIIEENNKSQIKDLRNFLQEMNG